MKILSLDLETTGLRAGADRILEGAFILEDTRDMFDENGIIRPVMTLPTFTFCIQWDDIQFDSLTALKMNYELVTSIPTRADRIIELDEWPPDAFELRFIDWITGLIPEGERVIPCGKNVAGFDIPFLVEFNDEIPGRFFRHRVIDLGSVALAVNVELFEQDSPPDMGELCAAYLGSGDAAHTAIQDARDNLHLLRKMTHTYGLTL